MTLGKRLNEARQKNNLTQKKAAAIIGIANTVLSRYESDERSPDLATLAKIATTYGVSTDWLLGLSTNTGHQDPPNYDEMVLSAKNLGEALIVIANLKSNKDIPKDWFSDILDKAIDKFGIPEPVQQSEPAAHGPKTPGTGIRLND